MIREPYRGPGPPECHFVPNGSTSRPRRSTRRSGGRSSTSRWVYPADVSALGVRLGGGGNVNHGVPRDHRRGPRT